ncbi:MAG: copper resistance protein NlpE [Fibrobacter sp.]|nr:copper resistance protein NlpE [Fibrobacter sp.]
MNKIQILLLAAPFFMLSCGTDDPSDDKITGPDKQKAVYIGSWQYSFPAPIATLLKQNLSIFVKINDDDDSTYSLNVLYTDRGDTALRHNGYWMISESADTIILNGNDCAVYDTTKDSTVTKACGSPVQAPIDIKNDTWTVSLGALAPVGPSLGIDPTSLSIDDLNGLFIPLKRSPDTP